MSFTVKAKIDGHGLSENAKSAKEAFAKAVDWHVAKQPDDVVISDGDNEFSIGEFSEMLAASQSSDPTQH
jgi:hypothetical protein